MGALTHVPINVNTDPSRKRCVLHLWQEGSQKEEERFFSMLGNSSAKEKTLYVKLPVSSNVLFVYNSTSQLYLLLYKIVPSPLLNRTCKWFTIVACPELQFLDAPK